MTQAELGTYILGCMGVKCSEKGCCNLVPSEWVAEAIEVGEDTHELVCHQHYNEWLDMTKPNHPDER